jgi:hypothetical protein
VWWIRRDGMEEQHQEEDDSMDMPSFLVARFLSLTTHFDTQTHTNTHTNTGIIFLKSKRRLGLLVGLIPLLLASNRYTTDSNRHAREILSFFTSSRSSRIHQ